ncbi:MAG TPA: universal stress protein [Treponemataceae bacterium]|nr:universal stress protein [Treponemataceae bacterium]
MQVYKKILVAIDCSSVDSVILDHVLSLAIQNRAKVYLLHIVHSHTLDQDRALRMSAEITLQMYCDSLRKSEIEVEYIIRSGEPETEILLEIKANDYDLVAMATHGHGFFGDLLFGSVSRTLKHKISIPLLLLKPKP